MTAAGITVKSQTFAEVTNEVQNFYSYGGVVVDGLFGLAYPGCSTSGATPPFVNMVNQGSISPVFSFWLNSLVNFIIVIIILFYKKINLISPQMLETLQQCTEITTAEQHRAAN